MLLLLPLSSRDEEPKKNLLFPRFSLSFSFSLSLSVGEGDPLLLLLLALLCSVVVVSMIGCGVTGCELIAGLDVSWF